MDILRYVRMFRKRLEVKHFISLKIEFYGKVFIFDEFNRLNSRLNSLLKFLYECHCVFLHLFTSNGKWMWQCMMFPTHFPYKANNFLHHTRFRCKPMFTSYAFALFLCVYCVVFPSTYFHDILFLQTFFTSRSWSIEFHFLFYHQFVIQLMWMNFYWKVFLILHHSLAFLFIPQYKNV